MQEERKERKTARRPRAAQEKITPEKEIISWRAAEYQYSEKTLTWFIVAGIIALVIAILSFVGHNFFFAVFAILAGIVVIAFAGRRPDVLDFTVSDEGVSAEGKFSLPFDEIDYFSLHSRPGRLDELVLKKRSIVNPLVRIPLDARTGERVRAFLGKRIREEEFQESLIDLLSDRFGL